MGLFPNASPEGASESLVAQLVNLRRHVFRSKRILFSLLAAVFLWVVFFQYDSIDDHAAALYKSAQGTLGVKHPIELLHAQAQERFEDLVSRQSKTPKQAEDEYRRRYGRSPPPGFNKWAQYAIAARSPIIDDYDIINDAVRYYYNMKPRHFVELMEQAVEAAKGRFRSDTPIALCEFKDGKFDTDKENCRLNDWFADMAKSTKGMAKNIPDLKLLINYLDEPSVLATSENERELRWVDKSGTSLADDVVKACELQRRQPFEESRRLASRIEDFGIPFVQDPDDMRDVCAHPELLHMHGMYEAPASANLVNVRVPLLSTGAPRPFTDLVIPSPQYVWDKNLADAAGDIGWAAKERGVYWAGSNTGSQGKADRDESWRNSQRQRFVQRYGVYNGNETQPAATYLQRSPILKKYEPYTSTELDRSLYNAGITAVIQCDPEACDKQVKMYGGKPKDNAERAMEYKYNADIDGNAYTNRFYRLLGSHSVPLKATIFREWHDERLIPWLHYVPISISYDEVPEVVRFLTSTKEGDKIGQAISVAGAQWHDRAISGLHQGIYLYRLMLELAWLQDPERIPEPREAEE